MSAIDNFCARNGDKRSQNSLQQDDAELLCVLIRTELFLGEDLLDQIFEQFRIVVTHLPWVVDLV